MVRTMVTCEPIGTIASPLSEPDDLPRQGANAAISGRIDVRPPYREGLAGYDTDRVVVVWFAHRADRSITTVTRGPGVFASRSQDRPNPICLTTCRVDAITEVGLEVTGLDAIDGSPVLDLKPPICHELE